MTRTKKFIIIIIFFFIGAWFIFKDTSALAYSQKYSLYSTLPKNKMAHGMSLYQLSSRVCHI